MNRLITEDERRQLLAHGQSRAAGQAIDPLPVVRLFTPDAHVTWLLAALDPADSIFTRLAGQTERLVTDKQLAEAVGQAPADTRAWLRAEIVRRFPEQVVAASWSHLTVRGESSGDENVENSMVSLDMSNPLKFTESLCSEAFEHVHTASGIVESLR